MGEHVNLNTTWFHSLGQVFGEYELLSIAYHLWLRQMPILTQYSYSLIGGVMSSHIPDQEERRRNEQYAALEATSVPLDEEDDVNEVLSQLRMARSAVAARRKKPLV